MLFNQPLIYEVAHRYHTVEIVVIATTKHSVNVTMPLGEERLKFSTLFLHIYGITTILGQRKLQHTLGTYFK
jgi:hypothetical protein